jgi:hypothetical protein
MNWVGGTVAGRRNREFGSNEFVAESTVPASRFLGSPPAKTTRPIAWPSIGLASLTGIDVGRTRSVTVYGPGARNA